MTIDNIDEMHEELKRFKSLKKELTEYCSTYLKNKNLPLEDRWKLFVENKNLFPIHSWILHFKDLDKNHIEYYDDFGYERYRTIEFDELVNCIEEGTYDNVNLNNLKEEMLLSGVSGFIFDW